MSGIVHLDHYAGQEPSGHVNALLARYGRSPRGFPLYRLVQSEYITELSGGEWCDWDSDLGQEDRGGIKFYQGSPVASFHNAIRKVIEVREVQKYSDLDEHGWVLERWRPGEYFGAPELWAMQVVKGTTVPRLGPYPYSGAYEFLTGPFHVEPSESFLEDFIQGWEAFCASFPTNPEAHVRNRVVQAEERERLRSERVIRENRKRIYEGSKSVLSSTTSDAGMLRQRMAQRCGIQSHVGN